MSENNEEENIPELWEEDASEDGWETDDEGTEPKANPQGNPPGIPAGSEGSEENNNQNIGELLAAFMGTYDPEDEFPYDDEGFLYDDDDYPYDFEDEFGYGDGYDSEGFDDDGYGYGSEDDEGYEDDEDELLIAVWDNDPIRFLELLNEPADDVNRIVSGDYANYTVFHHVATSKTVMFVKLCLASPRIDVNQQTTDGDTAIGLACTNDAHEAVKEMVMSDRVDLLVRNDDGLTPVGLAADSGSILSLKWLLASGRDIGELPAGDSLEKPVQGLLKDFRERPSETVEKIRRELGIYGKE